MTKEEIARFEQFLLLSQCFQKSSAADASTSGKGLINQILKPIKSDFLGFRKINFDLIQCRSNYMFSTAMI